MKKHWYDYLWIATLLYLVLGFFNILFAWLGLACFLLPLGISIASGTKAYCNRYCGRGQLFLLLGGQFGLSRKHDIPRWMRSKWFRYGFLAFFCDVLRDALEHLAVLCRRPESQAGRHSAVDLQAALAVGLPRHAVPPRRGPVCLRLLQRHAHFHRTGPCDDGPFQAPQLVRLLPHGHHDPADLQGPESGTLTYFLPGKRTFIQK